MRGSVSLTHLFLGNSSRHSIGSLDSGTCCLFGLEALQPFDPFDKANLGLHLSELLHPLVKPNVRMILTFLNFLLIVTDNHPLPLILWYCVVMTQVSRFSLYLYRDTR